MPPQGPGTRTLPCTSLTSAVPGSGQVLARTPQLAFCPLRKHCGGGFGCTKGSTARVFETTRGGGLEASPSSGVPCWGPQRQRTGWAVSPPEVPESQPLLPIWLKCPCLNDQRPAGPASPLVCASAR